MEEGDRGSYGPKTGRVAIEKKKKILIKNGSKQNNKCLLDAYICISTCLLVLREKYWYSLAQRKSDGGSAALSTYVLNLGSFTHRKPQPLSFYLTT